MFAGALERQWPRMPSKTSPWLVEKAGWALGCVTQRAKIEVRSIDLHLFRNFMFRSLSGAVQGQCQCLWGRQNLEQEQLSQEESDVAVQGAVSGGWAVSCWAIHGARRLQFGAGKPWEASAASAEAAHLSPERAGTLQRSPDHPALCRKIISKMLGEVRMGLGVMLKLLQMGVWPFPVLCASGMPVRQWGDENA